MLARVLLVIAALGPAAPPPEAPLEPGGVPGVLGPPAPVREVASIQSRLEGAYRSGDLTLHIRRLLTLDLPPSLYVEMTRRGTELHPVVRQVWSMTVRDGKPQVRLNEFPTGTSYGAVYTGAWAMPDVFPKLASWRIQPVCDLTVSDGPDGLVLSSASRAAIGRDFATGLDFRIALKGDTLTWRAVGYDAQGRPIWGEEDWVLQRSQDQPAAQKHDSGLVVIDLRDGQGPKVAEGDTVACDFTGYDFAGQMFISTHWPGRQMLQSPVPTNYIEGFSLGLVGMQSDGVRRLIIPPHLCFGPAGAANLAPSGSYLLYDVELAAVKDNTPEALEEPLPIGAEPRDGILRK